MPVSPTSQCWPVGRRIVSAMCNLCFVALDNRRGQRAGAVCKSICGTTKGSWSEMFLYDCYSNSSLRKGHSEGWSLPSLWSTLPLCSSFSSAMTASQPSPNSTWVVTEKWLSWTQVLRVFKQIQTDFHELTSFPVSSCRLNVLSGGILSSRGRDRVSKTYVFNLNMVLYPFSKFPQLCFHNFWQL